MISCTIRQAIKSRSAMQRRNTSRSRFQCFACTLLAASTPILRPSFAFANEGRKIGVDASCNVHAKHWKRLREAFLRCIAERDFIACLIVQEIMLESFAVASYARVGKVAPGSLGKTFASIAAEEEDHIDHAMAILRGERALDAQRFDDKVHRLHLDVMTTLAEMLARECTHGHCEVCHGSCVKPSL